MKGIILAEISESKHIPLIFDQSNLDSGNTV